MEKIKLGLFDIFAYIIPGFFILLSIHLVINETTDIVAYTINVSNKINLSNSILIILSSFVFGFLNQYVAYELFKIISKIIWKKRMNKETSFGKMENKIVLIRHFSPNNFLALHKWLALRGMCYGMFQSLILFNLILFIRAVQLGIWTNQRVVILFVFGISSILFLRRAVTFHEWAHKTIKHSYENINEFKKN